MVLRQFGYKFTNIILNKFKLILKIFYYFTQFNLPILLIEGPSFSGHQANKSACHR